MSRYLNAERNRCSESISVEPCGALPLADNVNLRERLNGVDQTHHEIEKNHGRKQRQRDMPEAPERTSAVQLGRLVELRGNVTQRGQINDHEIADAPQAHQHQRIF